MQFITNRIRTGNGKKFEDFVRELTQPKEVKTAATEEEVVKTAEQEEADSSGQLDVEPLHQKGESTEMPKKGPKAKKEGEAEAEEKEATVVKQDEEADSSGQPEWEGKQEHVNDPEVEEDAKGGSSKAKAKTAAAKCETCGESCDKCTCDDCKCASCTETKKTAALEDLPEEVQKKIKGEPAEEEDDKEAESKEEEKEEKKASAPRFVKTASLTDDQKAITAVRLAQNYIGQLGAEQTKKYIYAMLGEIKLGNLDGKNKSFLQKYWKQLFNEEYTNALTADK